MSRRLSSYTVYLVLSGATAFSFMVFGTLSSVYRFQTAGLSPFQLVLIGTVLELSVFVFEVPTGVVADLYSRHRSVIIGMFSVGAGFVLEGLVPIFATMLLAQVIWGVGATFESGAKEAWIADELGAERVGEAHLRAVQVGQLGLLLGVAVAVGLGGVYLGLPLVVGSVGFLGVDVFLLLFMGEHSFTPVRNTHPLAAMRETLRAGLGLVQRTPTLTVILAITGILGASSETFDRLWEAHILQNIGFPDLAALPDIAWFGLISAGAMLLAALAAEGVRRFNNQNPQLMVELLAGISTLLTLSVIGFGLAGNFAVALAFYWAVVLLRTVNAPLSAAWLNGYLEPRMRATVFSLNNQTDAFGQIAGGPVLGLLANVTLRGAFVGTGVLLVPAVLLYGWTLRRRGSNSERGAFHD